MLEGFLGNGLGVSFSGLGDLGGQQAFQPNQAEELRRRAMQQEAADQSPPRKHVDSVEVKPKQITGVK